MIQSKAPRITGVRLKDPRLGVRTYFGPRAEEGGDFDLLGNIMRKH